MTALTPRLRMFAGPNGSGKSTLKDTLPPQWLGVYVNADEIEKTIRAQARLNLGDFDVSGQEAELQAFQSLGYRTYLYFVATEDADINVARVQYRVQTGGHPVAEDKIRSRYTRSLALLSEAIAYADRAYIFDNSGHSRVWIAEITGGVEMEAQTSEIPAWFKTALWDNFEHVPS